MLFSSLELAIFIPLVAAWYFALPHQQRAAMLLVASYAFYMAFIPVYILILFLTIGIDYLAGIYIEESGGKSVSGSASFPHVPCSLY